ncbi:MAG: tRNA lysidine(34) synthetase TilS [Candidatus Mycalebacterium zealandia]|nr:MAG: tRNA lysidine(34) synthetase TilS [Candidatus Mycalebacterium zealandia]
MSLQEKLTAALKEFDMLPRPAMKVVAGVSGGADSVALVHALTRLEENAPEIIVCHFNHRLRGRESERDEEFVSRLCEKLDLRFEVSSCDTEAFSKQKKLSIESAARELRYEFFAEVCEKTGAERIATAHTADDRAETVLMRMLRGSGTLGISSIKPRSDNLIRPLINVSREEVMEYLADAGEKWVEDSSNDLTIFTRNRVRKQLLPLLETFNPQMKKALNRLADTAGRQSSYISLQASRIFPQVFTSPGTKGLLAGSVSEFRAVHRAVRSELLRTAYATATGGLERLEFSHLEEMDALLMSPARSGAVSLPRGAAMEKSYGFFCLVLRCGAADDYKLTVKGEGAKDLPDGNSAFFEKTSDISLWERRDVGHFSLEKTGFPIEVRNFRPGDRTVPLGMSGTKKLKSVFTERKIPSFLRTRLPIFTCKGEIIWAGGVVISDSHKAVKGAQNLRIKLDGLVPDLLETRRGG